MVIKSALILAILIASAYGGCERDKNVQFENPLYLNFGDGFFYIQGLTNGEAVVIYKHPDDARVFGQYTFKDEKCQYETVYYYVLRGKYEFTNPYIADESNFNITNKISFVKNGAGYEIEYSVHSGGIGIFQNLGNNAERKILPTTTFKRTPARQVREIFPNFASIGKQNLKVSYLRNGENFIQFIGHQSKFASIEGSYTFRTSDRRYHTLVYEIPLDDFDYVGMAVKEYEIATEENFFRSGILQVNVNGTSMDVKFYVNKNGFHVTELQRTGSQQAVNVPQQKRPSGVQRPFGPFVQPQRGSQVPQQNFRQPQQTTGRFLNPTFSRPDQLTQPQPPQPGR